MCPLSLSRDGHEVFKQKYQWGGLAPVPKDTLRFKV